MIIKLEYHSEAGFAALISESCFESLAEKCANGKATGATGATAGATGKATGLAGRLVDSSCRMAFDLCFSSGAKSEGSLLILILGSPLFSSDSGAHLSMSEDFLDIFLEGFSTGAIGSSGASAASAWMVEMLMLKGALRKESLRTGKEGSGNGFGAAGAIWLAFCCWRRAACIWFFFLRASTLVTQVTGQLISTELWFFSLRWQEELYSKASFWNASLAGLCWMTMSSASSSTYSSLSELDVLRVLPAQTMKKRFSSTLYWGTRQLLMISLMVASGERERRKDGAFQPMGLKWTVSLGVARFLLSRMWMMLRSVRAMGMSQLSILKPLQKRRTRCSGMLKRVEAMIVRSVALAGVRRGTNRASFLTFRRQTCTTSVSKLSHTWLWLSRSLRIHFYFITASNLKN